MLLFPMKTRRQSLPSKIKPTDFMGQVEFHSSLDLLDYIHIICYIFNELEHIYSEINKVECLLLTSE